MMDDITPIHIIVMATICIVVFVISRILREQESERWQRDYKKFREEKDNREFEEKQILRKNIKEKTPTIVAELRAKLDLLPALPANQKESDSSELPSLENCLYPYQSPGIDLVRAEVSQTILDNLPHIKNCPYCRSLLTEDGIKIGNFWHKVFIREDYPSNPEEAYDLITDLPRKLK